MPRVRPRSLVLVLALAVLLPLAGAPGGRAQDASPARRRVGGERA